MDNLERLLPSGNASQPEPQQHQAFSSPAKQQGSAVAAPYRETPLRCEAAAAAAVSPAGFCGCGGGWEQIGPDAPPPARLPHSDWLPLPHPHRRSPRVTYSDRFIPSRAASSRLDFSILDREAAASETPRRTVEKEESNGAYNMLLRSELLGCPAAPVSPEKAGGAGTAAAGGGLPGHPASPSKR